MLSAGNRADDQEWFRPGNDRVGKQSVRRLKRHILPTDIITQKRTALERAVVADRAAQHRIPLSSVYKKISELEELSLIKVEKWILSDNGKKFKLYRSRISKADVSIRKPEPAISLSPNLLSRVS